MAFTGKILTTIYNIWVSWRNGLLADEMDTMPWKEFYKPKHWRNAPVHVRKLYIFTVHVQDVQGFFAWKEINCFATVHVVAMHILTHFITLSFNFFMLCLSSMLGYTPRNSVKHIFIYIHLTFFKKKFRVRILGLKV